jgi:biotin transport system substrate-specific component
MNQELRGYKALVASLVGASLTAVSAQIAFYLPGNPVPVTMQVFAVACCGLLLGGRLGAISQLEYLAAGAVGAPVFAGFKGGWAALAGPTGGYLVGFVAGAFVIGLLTEKAHRRTFPTAFAAGMIGSLVILLCGRTWLSVWLGDFSGWRSWALAVAPFIGIDAVKIAAAAVLLTRQGK